MRPLDLAGLPVAVQHFDASLLKWRLVLVAARVEISLAGIVDFGGTATAGALVAIGLDVSELAHLVTVKHSIVLSVALIAKSGEAASLRAGAASAPGRNNPLEAIAVCLVPAVRGILARIPHKIGAGDRGDLVSVVSAVTADLPA